MIKYIKLLLIICIIFSFVFNVTYASTKDVTTEKPVPILTYHLVSNDIFSENTSLFTKPEEFEKQIKYIIDNGYTPIFAEDLSNAQNVEKPIIITFDDGYIDNYEFVYPLMKKYDLKFTIFVITSMVGTPNHLTAAQIKEMHASGLVSIQSHTVSHPYLSQLNADDLNRELSKSKAEIHNLTGIYPRVIAYPYGDFNEEVEKAAGAYYQVGYTTYIGNLSNGNKLSVKRFGVGRNTELKDIQAYLDTFK